MKENKSEYKYRSIKNDEQLFPEFIILNKSFLSKDALELALELKEKYGMPTISEFIEFTINFFNENQDKGDKLNSIKKTAIAKVGAVGHTFDNEKFVEQIDLQIMEKISKDTWGGVEH